MSIEIERNRADYLHLKMGRGLSAVWYVFTSAEEDKLKAYFRAEEDKRLGRWRYTEDLVVYPTERRQDPNRRMVYVLNEVTGHFIERSEGRNVGSYTDKHPEASMAARAYFEAHPESKPWHDAKPGELWSVHMDTGYVRECLVTTSPFDTTEFTYRVPNSLSTRARFDVRIPSIRDAHKIWSPHD